MNQTAVFFDLDGVLATAAEKWKDFNPKCVAHARALILEFDAIPVVHSTWRQRDVGAAQGMGGSKELCRTLWARHGLPKMPDFAPAEPRNKWKSIEWWLRANGQRPYLILDDEEHDFPRDRFVKTTELGLTEERLVEARAKLRALLNSGACS